MGVWIMWFWWLISPSAEQEGVEYACATCAESFTTIFDRELHQQKAHAIVCSHAECGQTFTSVPHLTLHTQRYHQSKFAQSLVHGIKRTCSDLIRSC